MKRYALILLILIMGCGSDEELPTKEESFVKIYDHSNYDLDFHPIDVVETKDGFIVLTGVELDQTDFMGVRLLKMNREGDYEFEQRLDDYVIPIGDLALNPADSNAYFFVANPVTLEAVMIGVTPGLEVILESRLGGLNYPLASSTTFAGNMLLLSYDPINLNTQISEVSFDGNVLGSASYSIGPGDDVQEEIIDHYLRSSDKPLPFFCGEFSFGEYYFNGFYNYNLSMVFTNLGDAPLGVLQGQTTDAGIRAAMPHLDGDRFAVAGYQFDDNYQLSDVTLSTDGLSSVADLYPGNMAEMKAYTPVRILGYELGVNYKVYAAETEGRQIVLNFYDATNHQIAATHHIGYINPYRFSSMKVTEDNGIMILGTTFVAGRFERIVLIKLSEQEVGEILTK